MLSCILYADNLMILYTANNSQLMLIMSLKLIVHNQLYLCNKPSIKCLTTSSPAVFIPMLLSAIIN